MAKKRPVGRPRKNPDELVHNTRVRSFHQIETNPVFDQAIDLIRIHLAAVRSMAQGKPYPVEKISKSAAVRYAVCQWAMEHLGFAAEASRDGGTES